MSKDTYNVGDTITYHYTREPLDIRVGTITEIDPLDGELYVTSGQSDTLLFCIWPREVISNASWITNELLAI